MTIQDRKPSSMADQYNHISNYDFKLPAELIAQVPSSRRDQSKLMVYQRNTGIICHSEFKDLFEFLPEPVLIVFNDTRVIPAKIEGIMPGKNKKIEMLMLNKISDNEYFILTKRIDSFRDNDEIMIGKEPSMTIRIKRHENRLSVFFDDPDKFWLILSKYGKPPLPPYIRRTDDRHLHEDRERYQTLYAKNEGSVAAPTAGLHFSDEMLKHIKKSESIDTAFVTLDISLATFRPVRTDNINMHKMEGERVTLDSLNAEKISKAKEREIPVVAVGTTTLKSLEGIYRIRGDITSFNGLIDLFIKPPFEFNIVDHLITNFHLPRSTLLMLVSAFAGIKEVQECYKIAIKNKYRFFSYGDAMLFL